MARAYYARTRPLSGRAGHIRVTEAAILRDEYWGSKGRTARHLAGRDDL